MDFGVSDMNGFCSRGPRCSRRDSPMMLPLQLWLTSLAGVDALHQVVGGVVQALNHLAVPLSVGGPQHNHLPEQNQGGLLGDRCARLRPQGKGAPASLAPCRRSYARTVRP